MTYYKSIIFLYVTTLLLWGCKNYPGQAPSKTTGIFSSLDSLLGAEEKKGFHGVVLVELDGQEVLSKGYGYANEASKLKFSPATLVQIGSGVKDFTKVAIYQLVETGKLSLHDPLSKVMPNLTGPKLKITVQHLLEHRSGLPLGEKSDDEPFTTSEMLAAVQTLTLNAEPGAQELYSNLGYSCLAYMVEQISGQSFDRYVYDHILLPIGLVNTGTYLPNFDRSQVAHGYDGETDIGSILDMPHDSSGHLWSLRGNGGYLSTTGEISKFFHALEGNILLKTEDYRKAVFDPSSPTVLAGSDMVSFFMISNRPDMPARIIIATNHSAYKAPSLLRKIEHLLAENNHSGRMQPEIQLDLGDNQEPGEKVYTGPLLEKLPEEGGGLIIKKYFDAFNTGDPGQMRKFFEDNSKLSSSALPIEQRLDNYKKFYTDMGKLTLVNLNASQSPAGIWEVMVTTSQGDSAKFIFHLEPHSPWKFERLQIGLDK